MTIALAHFTDQPKENPYVWSLGTELKRLGHDVRPMPASALFLKYASARQASTIHFQWFETLVGAPGRLRMVLKSVVFLAQLKLCRLLGKRLVWTVHNARSHEQQFPRIEHWVVSRIAANVHSIIVHCDSARDEVCRYLGNVDREKFAVIEHGSYIGIYKDEISAADARRSVGIDDNDTVILFLGNIRPYKGLDDLIAAFRDVHQPGIRLLIAGKPKNERIRADIEAQCDGQPDIVFLPAFIDDDDLQVYFRASDVVAFPYRTVLTSGAVILAMSFGKACIAPDIGCLSSVITRSANYLYSPVGLEGLRASLAKAIAEKDRLPAAGLENYERAKALDWRRIAAETARLYR
jgi:glycosyltransferase involved in cell wall biosynthesis